MYTYNVHHSCVADILTRALDTTAAVSIFMSEKSCNIITIKEECQVKNSGLGAFFLSSSCFHCFAFLHTILSVLQLPIYKKIQVKQGVDLKH